MTVWSALRRRAWIADDVGPAAERRPHLPSPRTVTLCDGSTVVVRPIHPSDISLLADGFERLSVQSRRHRFLTTKNRLTDAELRQLTELDHHDRDALGAVDVRTGQGVGVARYVRSNTDPETAEVAVTVVDAWHRRGVATLLLEQLTDRALGAGIYAFTALVSVDNDAMTGLLRRRSGVQLTHVDADAGTLEYEIALLSFGPSLDRAVSACEMTISGR
jgi:RimJ/RimL family protein N-acetyltransferase